MIAREQARNLAANMGGTITTSGPSVFTGKIPVRTELTILSDWHVDDPWAKGWLIQEVEGMSVVNPLVVGAVTEITIIWEIDDPWKPEYIDWHKLGAALAMPILQRLDYTSIARECFSVQPLPGGALPIYDRD